MKIGEIIKSAIEKKGFKNLKDASKALGVSAELLRVIMTHQHVPKDKTLALIARKLNLDISMIILAAHQEKVPDDLKGFFLTPSQSKFSHGKRKYPISEEQTIYLSKILSTEEIMLLRKWRQVSDEGRIQIQGYVDFTYASRKNA